MSSALSASHFHNEEAAYAYVEARIWPNGPVCPHCGGYDRISKMNGKSTRIGAHKCYQCRKPFTVKIGTIFEASHVPMRLWLQAIYLISASKKGFSSNQLHRTLGVTLKTAWFMSHRIREAMRSGDMTPFGGNGGMVEVDETYIGIDKAAAPIKDRRGLSRPVRNTVLTLLDRETGRTRSMVADKLTISTVTEILNLNMAKEARLMTDKAMFYRTPGKAFSEHNTVDHGADEYVRKGDSTIHTNTIEGFFSIFKRGMRGIYQHCAKPHLHRYLAEYDFRYSNRVALGYNDADRADNILAGVVGKRLTYQTVGAKA
ncbi:IS1595 family transposase [Asticcacaulis taihuensis]|uniref:IS1595 family transposase n=1 Tax=Asticcacaulis taihuensis TaxID=260084 RepID=UPI003F7C4BA9